MEIHLKAPAFKPPQPTTLNIVGPACWLHFITVLFGVRVLLGVVDVLNLAVKTWQKHPRQCSSKLVRRSRERSKEGKKTRRKQVGTPSVFPSLYVYSSHSLYSKTKQRSQVIGDKTLTWRLSIICLATLGQLSWFRETFPNLDNFFSTLWNFMTQLVHSKLHNYAAQ